MEKLYALYTTEKALILMRTRPTTSSSYVYRIKIFISIGFGKKSMRNENIIGYFLLTSLKFYTFVETQVRDSGLRPDW